MKKTISLLAAVAALAAAAPEAKAGHDREFIGYDRCGNLLYRVTYVVGYEPCGEPIYRCRTITVPRCETPRYDACDRGYRPHYRSYRGVYEARPGYRSVRW